MDSAWARVGLRTVPGMNAEKCLKVLKDHLENCPDCRENVESIRNTVDIFKKSNPDIPLSQKMKENLIKQLKGD